MLLFAHLAIQMIFCIRKIVNGYGDPMTYWLSTTIKRKHLDKILSGEKTSEYKNASEHWVKRCENAKSSDGDIGIIFICGSVVYRYEVRDIIFNYDHDDPFEIDDEMCAAWYDIALGARIRKPKIYTNIDESELRKYFPKWNGFEYVYCHDLLNLTFADCGAGLKDIILFIDVGAMDKLHPKIFW